jgi:hypothetical protein
MSRKPFLRLVARWALLVLAISSELAHAQTAIAPFALDGETEGTSESQRPRTVARRVRPRQNSARPTIIDDPQVRRAGQITTTQWQLPAMTDEGPSQAEQIETPRSELQGRPRYYDPATCDVDPRTRQPKGRVWKFKSFVMALPLEVGGTFGVPPGCQTRCEIERKFGPPVHLIHASTYYTMVDYPREGVRFYYDKESRTIGYSTFSPSLPGRGYVGPTSVQIVDSDPEPPGASALRAVPLRR